MKSVEVRISSSFVLGVAMVVVFLGFISHYYHTNTPSSSYPVIIIATTQPRPQQEAVLFPSWQVLLLLHTESTSSLADDAANNMAMICRYPNTDHTTPAIPIPSFCLHNCNSYFCNLPRPLRHRLPLPTPALLQSNQTVPSLHSHPQEELLRWNFVAYETLITQHDVVLFVKGVNKRQGFNRPPNSLACLFGARVRTAVTSSSQEVFRCQTPNLTGFGGPLIKASLEFAPDKVVVPSVVHYAPSLKVIKKTNGNGKSVLCACTMVYNVAKFLKEWILYHSRIGIDRFILYDNHSDDELDKIVSQLVDEGYDVETLFWLWPKTQEAGFSHCAVYANNSCKWMMYLDVDEFLYSPAWSNLSHPSTSLIPSMLSPFANSSVGQIMIGCHEFGPSNQSVHPAQGVTQGYNCRRRMENRHKSIVLLEAVDESLSNVIHHFELKAGYRSKKVKMEEAVVNHYKFQAWSEFKSKFRRRVSAYVVDWMQNVNPGSNDRTPGLGLTPVEPPGWPHKFCEVYDNQLKDLTSNWLAIPQHDQSHYLIMPWQP